MCYFTPLSTSFAFHALKGIRFSIVGLCGTTRHSCDRAFTLVIVRRRKALKVSWRLIFLGMRLQRMDDIHTDVLIIGSGPVGSTFARKLVEAGRTVLMIDAGACATARPGEHIKNSAFYQRNIDQFSYLIQSHLLPASVPTSKAAVPTLDPISFQLNARNGYDNCFSGTCITLIEIF